MRMPLNTMEIATAYRELEIKSAVCIGLDYGFDIAIMRTFTGTCVRFREVYEKAKDYDIEKIIIWFYNDHYVNKNNKNKIKVYIERVRMIHEDEEKDGEKIFDIWGDALPYIMELVWSIENR